MARAVLVTGAAGVLVTMIARVLVVSGRMVADTLAALGRVLLMPVDLPPRLLVSMLVGVLMSILAPMLMAVFWLLLRVGTLERAAVEQHAKARAGEAAARRLAALDADARQAQAATASATTASGIPRSRQAPRNMSPAMPLAQSRW
jgi:hypothetical protein